MGWRTVVVTQHAKLSLSMRSLVVQTRDGSTVIPLDDVEVLLIETTQAVLTTALLAEMAERQIAVIYTSRNGQPVGEARSLTPSVRTVAKLREQINWPSERIETAWTKIVYSKIKSQQQVLEFCRLDTSHLRTQLDKLELNDPTNREAVAARYYFQELFGKHFSRSNEEALNAALNYGYSILLSLTNCRITASGYLTQIGIHHGSSENSYNLGSDLMEPFRPVYDQWVSQQKFNELTPDVKFMLVDLLNVVIKFNGKEELLRNAIGVHVNNCLRYLSGEQDEIRIEVKLPSEVSSRAINGTV
ncbi:MAG: type II CRISPR-associated endonuclease Cas1 [Lacticaseibacillus songhuajiangensis]|nr:type II CRISPR-associated endonuclease Cas1 [Lacticaseibacillus songhuajiangensis]